MLRLTANKKCYNSFQNEGIISIINVSNDTNIRSIVKSQFGYQIMCYLLIHVIASTKPDNLIMA